MYQIYGCSDDLVCIDHNFGESLEEIGCYNKSVLVTIKQPNDEISNKFEGLHILMRYSPKWNNVGVWTAEFSPLGEDVKIPWPVSIIFRGRGYSNEALIYCPRNIIAEYKLLDNQDI